MTKSITQRPDFLASGERARLIPVAADSNKEVRATSCTLAAFMSVNEFANSLMKSVGVNLGVRSSVECFTEIVFKGKNSGTEKMRPDGLIIVNTGKKRWMALVEAKVGRTELQAGQLEAYLDLAKEHKIDAVITLSNQFATIPTHHPIQVSKQKTRSVALYHWSWTYLVAEAIMWVKHHGVTDPDQAYILEELGRYLQHENSKVMAFDRMSANWKKMCAAVHNRIGLKRTSSEVLDSVASWHQFMRSISLSCGLAMGANVSIYLNRAHRNDAKKSIEDSVEQLVTKRRLTTEFEVPNVTERVKVAADFRTRLVSVSMQLNIPKGRKTSKSIMSWLMRQTKKIDHKDIKIRTIWPLRTPDTMADLVSVRENGIDALLCDNNLLAPRAFELVLTRDLGVKFKGVRTFVQESEPLLLEFCQQAVKI